jgi:hypothetical protein
MAVQSAQATAQYLAKGFRAVSSNVSGMRSTMYNSVQNVRYGSAVNAQPLFEQPAGWGVLDVFRRTGGWLFKSLYMVLLAESMCKCC